MELAAEDGRAQRDRSYLRILAPPPTFSVSVSGAELRAAARRSRFPFTLPFTPPPTALCVLGCPWTALHLSFLHNTLFTRHSRRALARSQPQLLQLLIWVPILFFGPPLSPFFLLILLATTPSRCRQHGLYFTVSSSSLLPPPSLSALTPGTNTWFLASGSHRGLARADCGLTSI